VSLELAIVAPSVIAVIALVLLTGTLAQRQVRMQSAAESYATDLARSAPPVVAQNSAAAFQFLVTRHDAEIVCVQVEQRAHERAPVTADLFSWLPPLPSVSACAAVVPG
jgi:Flp pilus assembly protein TadG